MSFITWAWCSKCWVRTDHEVRDQMRICLECGNIEEIEYQSPKQVIFEELDINPKIPRYYQENE